MSPFGFANANEFFAWSDSYAAIDKSGRQEIASLLLALEFLGVTPTQMRRRLGVSDEGIKAVTELRRRISAESQLVSNAKNLGGDYDAR